MNDFNPGDRVRDTTTGEVGTVRPHVGPDIMRGPEQSHLWPYVRWDDGQHTWTNPTILQKEHDMTTQDEERDGVARWIARAKTAEAALRDIAAEYLQVPRAEMPEAVVQVDGRVETKYRSDGVIFSSPAGTDPASIRKDAYRMLAVAELLQEQQAKKADAEKELAAKRGAWARELTGAHRVGYDAVGPATKRAIDWLIAAGIAPGSEDEK